MIHNNKQNCSNDLSASFSRSADWRRTQQARYHDNRNGRAAEILDRLAGEVHFISDEAFAELKPFYRWASPTWSAAVSAVSREVGFRNVSDLPTYLNRLVSVLQQQSVAA